MKITMLRRDIWLGGETNTAYREGKTYDVPKERRDYFVARGSAVNAGPTPRTQRRQRDWRTDATGVEMQPVEGDTVTGDGSGHALPPIIDPGLDILARSESDRAGPPAPRDD